jgi:hypothetical protein
MLQILWTTNNLTRNDKYRQLLEIQKSDFLLLIYMSFLASTNSMETQSYLIGQVF